jgi:hypothetical protein
MFDKLDLMMLKKLIKDFKLSTKLTLTKVVDGKRKARTRKELSDELHKHLEIRSDGEIVMKEHTYGKIEDFNVKKPARAKRTPKPKPTPVVIPPTPTPAPAPAQIDYSKLDNSIEKELISYIAKEATKEDLFNIFETKYTNIRKERRRETTLRDGLGGYFTLTQIMEILETKNKPFFEKINKELTRINDEQQKPVEVTKKPTNLKSGFEFIQELRKLGEKNPSIDYDARGFVSDLLMLLFFEKYNVNCPFKYIEYGTKDKYKYSWSLEKFLKQLKRCLELGEKLFCIPFASPDHMNLLIIKVDTREIIRFEPHGEATQRIQEDKTNKSFNKNGEDLTKDINNFLGLNKIGKRPFKFVPPTEICPRVPATNLFKRGFQSLENMLGEKGGFCQMWSMFFMECVLRNPDMDIKEIYQKAYDSMNEEPKFVLDVIKGYYIQVNELLKDIGFFQKSIVGKELKIIHAQTFYDKYFKYIKAVNEQNESKPKIPFTGEGFKLPIPFIGKGFNLPIPYKK